MAGRFKITVTNPTDEKYVARIVVHPMLEGTNKADLERTLERHTNEYRAIGLASELLRRCQSVPPKLLAQVKALHKAASQ